MTDDNKRVQISILSKGRLIAILEQDPVKPRRGWEVPRLTGGGINHFMWRCHWGKAGENQTYFHYVGAAQSYLRHLAQVEEVQLEISDAEPAPARLIRNMEHIVQ